MEQDEHGRRIRSLRNRANFNFAIAIAIALYSLHFKCPILFYDLLFVIDRYLSDEYCKISYHYSWSEISKPPLAISHCFKNGEDVCETRKNFTANMIIVVLFCLPRTEKLLMYQYILNLSHNHMHNEYGQTIYNINMTTEREKKKSIFKNPVASMLTEMARFTPCAWQFHKRHNATFLSL